MPFSQNTKVISPKRFSSEFKPNKLWSPSYVDQYDFQHHLSRKGLEWNWQFDYGKGLVFTFSPNTNLTILHDLKEEGL